MNSYPRIVRLDDAKLKDLILKKNDLVLEGRKVAEEIDLIKQAQDSVDKKLVAEEKKVDNKDLVEKGNAIVKKIEALAQELNAVQKDIYERVKSYTNPQFREEYETLEKQKQDKEKELNKLGHKVQKVKDKIIPIVQKLGKPYLEDEWEDFNTTKLDKDGIPILEIYSKLEEWKNIQRTTNK